LQNEIASNTDKEVKIKELQAQVAALDKEAPAYKQQLDLLNKAREEAEAKVAAVVKSKEDLATEFNKQLSTLKDEKNELEIKLKKDLRSLEADKQETEAQLKSRISEAEKETQTIKMNAEAPKTPEAVKEEVPTVEIKSLPEIVVPAEAPSGGSKPSSRIQNEEKKTGKVVTGSVIEKDATKKEVLVDLVKADGVALGQTLEVMREDEKIADLKVIKVMDSFTITKPLTDKDFNTIELFDKAELSL